MKPIFIFISVAIFASSCSKPKESPAEMPETLTEVYDETEMDAAISKARSELQDFITVLEANGADSFSVKAPITDSNGTEHFWITGVTYNDGEFSGQVGNEPGIVKNVKMGENWKIKRDEISDWMFTRGDKIHGGFTIDPLLKSYPEDQAAELRSKLVR